MSAPTPQRSKKSVTQTFAGKKGKKKKRESAKPTTFPPLRIRKLGKFRSGERRGGKENAAAYRLPFKTGDALGPRENKKRKKNKKGATSSVGARGPGPSTATLDIGGKEKNKKREQ